MSLPTPTNKAYQQWLKTLKEQIQQTQFKTAQRVNSELVLLYWRLGKSILEKQETLGWGAKVVAQLAKDLRRAFPKIKGFSRTNLLYMRAFAEAYNEESFVQQLAGQIPWFHNCILLDRVKDPEERTWYIQQTLKNGWSRNVLAMQIDRGLHARQGTALTNFEQTLPALQSDLAREILKDPYTFDFLGLGDEAQERDIEQALLLHIRDFLLELGVGFAFVGSQYHLEVGGDDFYIDLLFYHLQLRCYVVIDLKTGKFKPDYAGQMNFYLSALDDLLRHPSDAPSIGLILCRDKNEIVVEYSLKGQTKPMGVSGYELTRALPASLKGKLPTVKELEQELGKTRG
jgi:predicted nuclease of restriction endonuclease-like (RecB) superfamily